MIIEIELGVNPRKLELSLTSPLIQDVSLKPKILFDLIGDVHGHLDLLVELLKKLGYSKKKNSFLHPEGRKVIFVGDLINRGPDTEGVLHLVREMNEQNQALISIGNHEFRAIQESVRFGKLKNNQLNQFIPWIRSWPLFLDLEDLRVVHAVWHFSSISKLKTAKLDDDSFIESTWQKESLSKKAVQIILSGLKVSLPEELEMRDRFGIIREKGRIKWWIDPKNKPFSEYLLSPMYPSPNHLFPSTEEVKHVEPYPMNGKPVFFGHYCLPPEVPKIDGMAVCLDGCVTCDKKLWAYQWQGENSPDPAHLISFPAD